MKKFILICFATFLFTNNSIFAESLSECRKISNDQKRLNCYDQIGVFSEKPNTSIDDNKETLPSVKIKAEVQKSPTLISIKPQPKEKSNVPTGTENSTQEAVFGLERKISADTINSSILGEFKGWKKNTIFKLANGQTWKVSNSGTRPVYRPSVQDPKVKISKGFLNSYKMKVEGVNSSVKVKRIK